MYWNYIIKIKQVECSYKIYYNTKKLWYFASIQIIIKYESIKEKEREYINNYKKLNKH